MNRSLAHFFNMPNDIITIKELKDHITSHIVENKHWWYLNKKISHRDAVTAVCFSPDGTRFATGYNEMAYLFTTDTYKTIASFAHKAPVWRVECNTDTTTLYTSSRDCMHHNFAVNTQTAQFECGYDKDIRSICNSKKYYVEGRSKSIHIRDKSTDNFLVITRKNSVNSVSLDPSNKYLAVAENKYVAIYDVKKEKMPCHTLFSFDGTVHSVYFSPCGNFLAVATADKAYIYDINTNKLCASFTHIGKVYATCFDFSGKLLATGSTNCASIFALHDTWTLEQYLLKKVLLTWLLIEKPNKNINSMPLLLANVAKKCELLENELDMVWKTLPETMQSALWRTMREKIKRYGKEVKNKKTDDNCIIS